MNKVLIIDDDKELCALIKQSILQECIEADCCYSGKSGLLQLKEKEYQLVILDVMMPGFDGFETLEQIRQESSLPILMFIGNLKQIFNLSFHISANGDKSWILRLFRHLSYREILGISLCFSA